MPSPDQPRFSRRQLVVGGAAVATAAALPTGLLAEPGVASAAVPALSLGYVVGSAGASRLADLTGTHTVKPATTLPTGSPALRGATVRVAVEGMTPAAILPSGVAAVDFEIHVPIPRAAAAPSQVWSLRPGRASAPSSFATVPATAGSSIWVLSLTPTSGPAVTRSATPVAGGAAGRPKLTPGVYLAGLGPATWARARPLPPVGDPAWSNLASIVLVVPERAS